MTPPSPSNDLPPDPLDGTQALLGSIHRLLNIADGALEAAEPLLYLIGLVHDSERVVTLRSSLDVVRDGLPKPSDLIS